MKPASLGLVVDIFLCNLFHRDMVDLSVVAGAVFVAFAAVLVAYVDDIDLGDVVVDAIIEYDSDSLNQS